MPEVEVVDYGGGNMGSLTRCLERLQVPYALVDAANPPSGQRPLILPGVGAFGAVCAALQKDGLDQQVTRVVKTGTPFLGICVGLQILLESSEESPGASGLGLVPGKVVRYQAPKVPQVGWNAVRARQSGWPDGFVYFVNSYHAQLADPSALWYQADYSGSFCAALRTGNISAFQFHPEKSGPFGQSLLEQWCREACAC
jgi:glutamine amidotransferase